ncbi:MAG: NAD(P)-dependent oxidoreductase, partial [Spirochaetales bacterium]|nr:NAD(P)-dependent oxidoreductase [Spirochaetales bacterium]
MNKKIAVMGAGIIATGIGKTLIDNGYEVNCFNRTKENASELIQAGAAYFTSPAAAAAGADFVISAVWNKDAFDSIMLGDDGLYKNASKGQIFIDMSTQLPDTALDAAAEFAKKGAFFIDAPIHGSKAEANSGGLWIMAGGEREIYDRASVVLSVLGETVHYMGSSGKGYASKLCGNHLVSTVVAAVCESIVLASKAGIDPEEIVKVWMESDFRSPVVGGVGGSVIDRDFDVSFHLRTMVKDTELIRNFSESLDVPVFLSNIVHEVNKVGQNMGFGEENASAVVKVFEHMAGTEVKKNREGSENS